MSIPNIQLQRAAASRHTSCKVTRAILEYAKRKSPETVAELLAEFPYLTPEGTLYTEEFLSDTDKWVDVRVSNALFQRMREVLGDEEITFKIASAAPDFRGIGGNTEAIARVLDAGVLVSSFAPGLHNQLTRTSTLASSDVTEASAKIQVKYNEGIEGIDRDSCDFARGLLSSVPRFCGDPENAIMRETRCRVPIDKKGIIRSPDGSNPRFYVVDNEDKTVWEFPSQNSSVKLPAKSLGRYNSAGDPNPKGMEWVFETRDGAGVRVTGRKIDRPWSGGPFSLGGTLYGADYCEYHMSWTPKRGWAQLWRLVERLLLRGPRISQSTIELIMLQDTIRTIQSTIDTAEVLEKIANAVIIVTARRCKIALFAVFDEATRQLIVKSYAGIGSPVLERGKKDSGARLLDSTISFDDQFNLIAQAARKGETLQTEKLFDILCPIIKNEEIVQDIQSDLGIKRLVIVPTYTEDGHLVGELIAGTEQPVVSQEDLELLGRFSNQAATPIRNAQLYGRAILKLERKVKELEHLRQIDRAILSTLEIDAVLKKIRESACTITCADDCNIFLIREDDSLSKKTSHGVGNQIDHIEANENKIVAWAVENKTSALIPDLDVEPWLGMRGPDDAETHSQLVVPIMEGSVPVGAISLQDKDKAAFSSDDQQLLEMLAGQTAIAIKNVRQYNALQEEQSRRIDAETIAAMGDVATELVHRLANLLGLIHPEIEDIREHLEIISERVIASGISSFVEIKGAIEDLNPHLEQIGINALEAIDTTARIRHPFAVAIEAVNVNNAVEQAVASVSLPTAVTLVTELTPGIPEVVASPMLVEVFRILVNNAIEAMPEGGTLHISSRVVDRKWADVVVQDTGTGIPREHLARLFSLGFTTKGKRKRDVKGGFGFGLWWVRMFLRRIGGAVTVETVEGKSSTFTIRLPIASSALVIEDDPQWATRLKTILQKEGYLVGTASKYLEAMSNLATRQFAIVTLDMNLEGEALNRDGLKILKALNTARLSLSPAQDRIEAKQVLAEVIQAQKTSFESVDESESAKLIDDIMRLSRETHVAVVWTIDDESGTGIPLGEILKTNPAIEHFSKRSFDERSFQEFVRRTRY